MNVEIKKVNIDLLGMADWNYKVEDDIMMDKIIDSLKKYGQVELLVVRKVKNKAYTYEVINGNHRLIAMKKLGFKKVYVADCGEVEVSKAKQLALVLNELRFPNDEYRMGLVLEGLIKNDVDIEDIIRAVNGDKKYVDELVDLCEQEWDKYQLVADVYMKSKTIERQTRQKEKNSEDDSKEKKRGKNEGQVDENIEDDSGTINKKKIIAESDYVDIVRDVISLEPWLYVLYNNIEGKKKCEKFIERYQGIKNGREAKSS